jgi:hypothetical protein
LDFFEDLATGARPFTNRPMRWDGTAEPFNFYVDASGKIASIPDMTKVPQSLSLDVAPNTIETVAVGLKYDGDEAMYVFHAWSYFHGGPHLFRHPSLALSGDEYRIQVRASAGGITEERTLRVRNYGTGLTDFGVVAD